MPLLQQWAVHSVDSVSGSVVVMMVILVKMINKLGVAQQVVISVIKPQVQRNNRSSVHLKQQNQILKKTVKVMAHQVASLAI